LLHVPGLPRAPRRSPWPPGPVADVDDLAILVRRIDRRHRRPGRPQPLPRRRGLARGVARPELPARAMTSRPRRVTSGTWQGRSADARALLDAGEHAPRLGEALLAWLASAGVELTGEAEQRLRAIAVTHTRETYLRGTSREASLESALAAERAIRLRLEALLRAHGIVVPTDRAPSEPPGE